MMTCDMNSHIYQH